MKHHLDSVIGQKNACNFISVALESAAKGGKIPSVAFDGEAGKGKTHLMHVMGRALKEVMDLDESQYMFLASPAAIRNQESQEYMAFKAMISSGLPYVLVIDEIEDITKKPTVAMERVYRFIRNALDNERKNPVQFDEDTIAPFDKRENVIICGSNFLAKMGDAFLSRFSRIILEDYTEKEIQKILLMKAGKEGIAISETALIRACRAGRGNVRFLDRLMEQLEMRHTEGEEVSESLMLEILRTIGLFPRGLTTYEIRMMMNLQAVKKTDTLYKKAQLSTVLNIAQKDFNRSLAYLASPFNNFVAIIADSLKLTKRGHAYLNKAREWKFIPDSGELETSEQ